MTNTCREWRLQTVRCALLSSTYVSCLTSRHTPLNPYWLCVNRLSTNSHVFSELLMNTRDACCIQLYYRESAVALCLAHDGRYIALSTASPSRGKIAPMDSLSSIPRRPVPCIRVRLLQAWSQRHRQTRSRGWRAGCSPVHRSRHRRCPSHTFTASRSLEIHRGLRRPVRASCQPEALARARCQGKRTAGK